MRNIVCAIPKAVITLQHVSAQCTIELLFTYTRGDGKSLVFIHHLAFLALLYSLLESLLCTFLRSFQCTRFRHSKQKSVYKPEVGVPPKAVFELRIGRLSLETRVIRYGI